MAAALADPFLVDRLIVEDAAPVPYRAVGQFEVLCLCAGGGLPFSHALSLMRGGI